MFLATRAGLPDEAGGLAGIFSGLIFALPIVAGVLVDRYGFRRTLMACFAIFSVGYFLIGVAGMEWGESIVNLIGRRTYVITVLLLTAIGGSLIKPCIVGTVANTTNDRSRAQGFSIYYSLVNLGGAIGPMLALLVRQDWGIEYVLVMSSFTSFLLLIGTYFFFNDPAREEISSSKRTFGKVFGEMIMVFSNFRFILFLVIFSGFWIMFWQIFYLIPFYSTDILHFEQFEILETVDSWCIIFFSVLMASLFKKWKPFTVMMTGFLFASVSWVIIGLLGTTAAVVFGVAIFAIGEATQAPRFYEYVSSLAPASQVGTYMGFAFLPVAIGSVVAGLLSDWLRLGYMATNPAMMWFILAGIGGITTTLLFLYNQFIVRK